MTNRSDKSAAWSAHAKATRLCRTVMGGTAAMREARTDYLPAKRGEPDEDYQVRLKGAVLDNYFKQTVSFYEGQIFQKPVHYQETSEGSTDSFDREWFETFAENVDQNGRNLNMFAKKVFKGGVVEGVSFIVVDHTRPKEIRKVEGTDKQEYLNESTNNFEPWTKAAEEALGLRPYFILVKAEQVLDAWVDVVNGRKILKHFRYAEAVERPLDDDGIRRETVTRVVAWWPNKWEVWETQESGGNEILKDSGTNNLGIIPVAWFMPEDDDMPNLTAAPPLADLAEQNRSYWVAWSEEDGRLMPFVRSPAFLGKLIGQVVDPETGEKKDIIFGPGLLISCDSEHADLRSVGVDPASVQNSRQNLQDKQDSMRNYGLQSMMPNITATQSENSAVTVNAFLRGLVEALKDCLENALHIVALYRSWADGPAVVLNKEFKRGPDLGYLNFLLAAVKGGVYKPEVLAVEHIAMMTAGDEWTAEKILNPGYGEDSTAPDEPILPSLGGRPQPRPDPAQNQQAPPLDGGGAQ